MEVFSRYICGSKHAHLADPTSSHVSTGDCLRVGWINEGDTRAEDSLESHLPRVRFYQDYKVTENRDLWTETPLWGRKAANY